MKRLKMAAFVGALLMLAPVLGGCPLYLISVVASIPGGPNAKGVDTRDIQMKYPGLYPGDPR